MRKAWIWTICGLPCANHGSMLCATIHGLSALTVDPQFVQHKVRYHKLKGQGAIAERDCPLYPVAAAETFSIHNSA